MEVHHREKLSDGGAAFDLANLVCLCRRCHFASHKRRVPQTPGRKEWIAAVAELAR